MASSVETSKRPRVALLMEPDQPDFARTIIVLAFMARDYLSIAERGADSKEPQFSRGHAGAKAAILATDDALSCLKSCDALLKETTENSSTRGIAVQVWLERASHAAEATRGHIRLYISYDVKRPDNLEADRRDHLRSVWRRSAQQARQESHRALTELCELFPDAYEIDDIAAEA